VAGYFHDFTLTIANGRLKSYEQFVASAINQVAQHIFQIFYQMRQKLSKKRV